MKIRGKKLQAPQPMKITFYREGPEQDIEFMLQAVLDFTEFDKICPEPVPPLVTPMGKPSYSDVKDKKYLRKVEERHVRRMQWMRIVSLTATEGLEFERVNIQDPETWKYLDEELGEFLTVLEAAELENSFMLINQPTEETRKQAVSSFAESQEGDTSENTTQKVEQSSTPSGEPANA